MNQWAVAPPTADSARVLEIGRNAQVRGDRRNRVVDDDGLVRPEVVDEEGSRFDVLIHDKRYRGDAVADVEVRLLLPTVAEHAQMLGILAKTPTEIEDVTMRIALAEDRNETKDEPNEAVAMCVRLDQALPGELRGAVERGLHRERTRLRGGEDFRLAVIEPVEEKAMRLTPAERIASSTAKVAIVFSSRSTLGWSNPWRTSALAAR